MLRCISLVYVTPFCLRTSLHAGLDVLRQDDPEGRPFAGVAADADGAFQQQGEFLAMASPRPVPPCWRVTEPSIWRNFSKIRPCLSVLDSRALVADADPTGRRRSSSAPQFDRPAGGENLIALDRKLYSICCNFGGIGLKDRHIRGDRA